MSKRIAVVLTLAVFLAAFSGVSFAEEGKYESSRGMGQHMSGPMMGMMGGHPSWSKGSKSSHQDLESKFEKKVELIFKNKDELGLSDQQVDKLSAIKLKTKKEVIRQKADIEIIGLDIKSELYNEKPDLEVINGLIDKKYEAKKAKAKALTAGIVELKSVLTDKQMDELKELYKQCPMEKEGYKASSTR